MPTLLYIPRFDECGAGPRYRVYQYFDHLKSNGFNIVTKPLFNIRYLNNLYFKKKRSLLYMVKKYFERAFFLFFAKSKYDLILMDGELFPFIPYFIEKLFLPAHFIVDQDDAIFHTYDKNSSRLIRLLFANKIKNVWKKSHHVIVCNNYNKENVIAMGINQVTALPTVVNADLYKPSLSLVIKNNNAVIIGWVGSPATIDAMDHIKPALINIAKYAHIVVYIIGAQYHIPNIETICIDWKEGWSENEEIKLTNEIDIGIMPLLDGPYQRGKGGFKLIKYMACAKPVVASYVGVNSEIVMHDKTGYLAVTVEDWEKYLMMLIKEPDKRKQLGLNGRQRMLEHYSSQVTAPAFCNILTEAYKANKVVHI